LELGRRTGLRCFINTDTILDKRINDYTLTKKQFKEWLYTYSADLICINVALEHFYGPFDDKSKFVSNIISQLLNEVVELEFTPGEQKRDFIYISDAVSAFETIVKRLKNLSNGIYEYQVGTGVSISIKDIVVKIKSLCGNNVTNLKFGALPYRLNEIMNIQPDISSLVELGWKPTYDIERGLAATIAAERKGPL
jgi:nucleoside-diphosphate-sugar epimerase